MRRALVIVAVGAALAVAAGCSGEHEVAPLPETVVGDVEAPPAAETVDDDVEAPPAAELPEGDPAAGKEIFNAQACGSCHTLADAGSSGTIGPNLDDSKPALELVITRVTNGSGAMPSFRDQLDDQQIADVAAYVVQATSG